MDYKEANKLLGVKYKRKVALNTYLERMITGTIGVLLYSTYVVRFYPNGDVSLHTGGYHTRTTLRRLNAYSPVKVVSSKGNWYVLANDKSGDATRVEFYDGIRFNRYGKLVKVKE